MIDRMRAVRLMSACCIAVVLAACAGSRGGAPSERPQRYDLGPFTSQSATPGANPQGSPLVLSMDAAPILADTGILWRVGNSAAPQAYAQARWAATPVQLVRQRLVDHMSQDRPVLAESVVADVAQLRITLTRFEQVFATDGSSSQGHVDLQVMMVQNRKILSSTRIQVQAPADTQDAEGGVQALRAATDQAAKELSYWASVQNAPAKTR